MFELIPQEYRPLGTLRKGDRAIVAAIVSAEELESRLLEMGFVEGAPVELVHEGPVGRDPVAIQLHGCTIALRRQEANAILVQ